MKRKLLPLITILILVACTTVSCLNSDDEEFVFSSDDTIHYFELDTIYGKRYPFTIDNRNGKIFNQTPLPAGADTIINKTLISKIVAGGVITKKDTTVFDYANDTVDLTKPLELMVWAMNGVDKREYTVNVKVYKNHPDSLVWKKTAESFTNNQLTGRHKSVCFNEQIYLYQLQTVYFSSVADGQKWEKREVLGVPSGIIQSTPIVFKDKLYYVDGSGIYQSEDGFQWGKVNTTVEIKQLLASNSSTLMGVASKGGKLWYSNSQDGETWTIGREIADDTFPLADISYNSYLTTTGLENTMIVGDPVGENVTPWFTDNGLNWDKLVPAAQYACPKLESPVLFRYNSKFYLVGGDFSNIYESVSGMNWRAVKKKVLLPAEFKDRSTSYSVVVSPDQFIWFFWTNPSANEEIWKGILNEYASEL